MSIYSVYANGLVAIGAVLLATVAIGCGSDDDDGGPDQEGPGTTVTRTNPLRCTADADCENPDAEDGEYCRADGWCASKIFETVWDVKFGSLTLPYYDDGSGTAKCDFTVLWGDEKKRNDFRKGTRVTDCTDLEQRSHNYGKDGTYHVRIKGVYNGWGREDPRSGWGWGEEKKSFCEDYPIYGSPVLKQVVSFGPVGLTAFAFGCTDGVKLPTAEVPDASVWTNAHRLFAGARRIDKAVKHWDTSNVTDMSEMFSRTVGFNVSVNSWNTANVTNMSQMFYQATGFNQPLDSWNTANVTNMSWMFNEATRFDQNLVQWNVSSVTSIFGIFIDSGLSQSNYCAMMSNPHGRNWDSYHLAARSIDCP